MSAWRKHYLNYTYLLQLVFLGRFVLGGLFGLPLEGLGRELGKVSSCQSRLEQGTHFELEEGFYGWVSAVRLT